MNKIKLLSIPILCLSFLSGCQDEIKADMVVFGDQIYTANKKGEFADAFAIKDGKYIYVGNVSGVDKYIGKNTSVYYLPFVMPSGIESHAHFILEQAFLETCYINPKNEDNTNKTKKEILDFIEQYALNNCNPLDPEDSLFGYGYDQLPFMKQGIDYTREDLDRLADGYLGVIPVYIAETSLHQAWVNTLTLQRAGIKIKLDKNETDPVSGILRDENGYATGVIINEACAYVLSKGYRYPILNEIGYQRVIKNTCSYLNEMGYTGHYDAWSNFDGTTQFIKLYLNSIKITN